MERLIGNNDDKSTQSLLNNNVYYPLIICNLITAIIFYVLFLLVQIIDIIAELINYDKDLLIFFYLRFIFFGFSLILHVIAIFTIIIFISLDSKVEKIKFLEEKFFSTFSKIVIAIFIVWTLGLLCLCVPRMVIFFKNGDKIGKFISTLIYLKSFLLIPVYLNIILVYILHRHQSKSEKKD